MDRKTFLKYLASTVALGGMGGLTSIVNARDLDGLDPFQPRELKLAILYTNDTHSRMEPNSRQQGGIARRATLIKQARRENPHTLLLDAGDTFQGTTWFARYGGAFQFKVMSKLGYQAMVLGNHEFDQGIEKLADAIRREARFPILAANYDVSNSVLKDLVDPFTVIEVNKVRIGIFGLGIPLDGLVTPEKYKGVRIRNPLTVARGMVRSLRTYKDCDMVIGLSHLGFSYKDPTVVSDRVVAQKVRGIDVIIGGHSHNQLEEPVSIQHPSGWQTMVTQAGSNGTRLGKLEVLFRKTERGLEVQV